MGRQQRTAVALSVTVMLGGVAAYAATPVLGSKATQASVCNSHVLRGVLPVWARGGFSDAKPRMPHVLGAAGSIVAILWADPLESPAPKDHNNKILWVSRAAANLASDLRIRAQRMSGSRAVGSPVTRRVMGGPGPSIINLPSPGCWRFTLRWSGRVDTLDLQYVNR
jgi:hypothetical protein